MKKLSLLAIMAAAVTIPSANATTIDFGSGSATGEAIFTWGTNTLTLTLTDTVVNPGSVASDLSGFRFTVAGSTGALLVSSSGVERTVNGTTGAFSDGAAVATGWNFSAVTTTYTLNDLGGAGPAHTLIGQPDASNLYSAANSSITNGPHTPELHGPITFNFTFTGGVSSTSTPTNIAFQFGTTDGFTSGGTTVTPEPISLSLVGGGLLALGLFRKRFVA